MKISEFAKATNVNIETVRYYHRTGVLDTPISSNSYRQYSAGHIKQMEFIKNAKLAGFSIAEIRKLRTLDAIQDKKEIREISLQKKIELENKFNEMKASMSFIESLITECQNSNSRVCPIIKGLENN